MSNNFVPAPVYRRLRGYSFDPSLSIQLDTALINEAIFKIIWEADLQEGPVGEYLEIVDFDPASGCFYAPVDLNDPNILATDGLVPSESNPQFHQQMTYAVAMTTIQNFEKALGRRALWSSYRKVAPKRPGDKPAYFDEFYPRLRIYPHALRQPNAYYSPGKKALLFGYFPASPNAEDEDVSTGIVFTCLSHDIIAHETTHALLDGIHRRYIEPSHPDTLAFHEAFADIVALFQHFSFPEVLRHQIAKTRGNLAEQSLLGQLAQQFGRAIGGYGALRDAIGEYDKTEGKWKPRQPNPNDYQTVTEPHARGAILVAAVFEAFISIYKSRVADLLRIASGGTGILVPGELHPDLVNRLANTAAKVAQQVLNMCIRALDYCPPADVNFGEYLRAIITADKGLVPDDDLGYRIAFIDAFRRRGIYPRDIRTMSEESLGWNPVREDEQQRIFTELAARLRFFVYYMAYLNEFPKMDDLESFEPTVKQGYAEKLIKDKEERWDEMDAVQKDKIWARLFIGAPADKKWSELSKARVDRDSLSEKDMAERVLWESLSDREKIHSLSHIARKALHRWIADFKGSANSDIVKKFEDLTGLYLWRDAEKDKSAPGLKSSDTKYVFEVHSFRGARRVGPDGEKVDEVIISLTQERSVPLYLQPEPDDGEAETAGNEDDEANFLFRGGCTLILDLQTLRLKYVIKKRIDDEARLDRQRAYRTGDAQASLRFTYFGRAQTGEEPFALLHSEF
jgi:hypothetical protein